MATATARLAEEEDADVLPNPLPASLTVKQLSLLVGIKYHDCYPLVASGTIPGGYRVGARWRIDRDTVLAWRASGGTPTQD